MLFDQVAFQKTLQLSYIDKLLNDIQLEFRDKYKDDLEAGVMRNYEFNEDFNRLLKEAELRSKLESQAPTKMRTFEESKKSQKTVASLKIDKNEKNKESAKNTKKGGSKNKKPEVMEEGKKYIEDIAWWHKDITFIGETIFTNEHSEQVKYCSYFELCFQFQFCYTDKLTVCTNCEKAGNDVNTLTSEEVKSRPLDFWMQSRMNL